MLQKIALYFCVLLVQYIGFSQTKPSKEYTLTECINIALTNNLALKASVLNGHTAEVNFKQAKGNLLPTLNANYNIGVNTGRSIDPFTNGFINQQLTFSNAQLSLDATIFNGFRLLNTVKQQRLNKKASDLEIEEAKQNLVLDVTLSYLQILNNMEVLELVKQRLESTIKQYKRQKVFYTQGVGNPADYTDIKGQKIIDETAIVISETALKKSKLNLASLLNSDLPVHIAAANTLLEAEPYNFSSESVFKAALTNLTTFKAKKLRIEAAKKGIRVAQSQYIPEFSVFGQLNTNYSSAAEVFFATGTQVVDTGDFVTINNQEIPVQSQQTEFDSQKIDYQDQFDNNLNTVVGIAVSIPLFNGFRAKHNVALEKIKAEEALIALELTQQEIKNTIKQVHLDMQEAYLKYNSLKSQVVAFEASFRVNEIRFNNGVSNFIAYITSKNNLENARTSLIHSKYDYALRVKVLEYYRSAVF